MGLVFGSLKEKVTYLQIHERFGEQLGGGLTTHEGVVVLKFCPGSGG
jgi:hypothetical protein